LKYIMLKVGRENLPIIFPEVIQHTDIAKVFNHPVTSAGFLQLNHRGKLETVGESVGLKIKARPFDVEVINLELEPFEFVLKQRGK
jgi:hypothetical protein